MRTLITVALALAALAFVALVPQSASADVGTDADLLAWFRESGIVFAPSATIGSGCRGRGVFAKAAIKAGDEVLRVPLSAVINVEHALVSEEVGSIWDGLDELADLDIFAAFVAYERFKASTPQSQWGAYLHSIPATFDTPLFYTDLELEALRGSPTHAAALARREHISATYATIITHAKATAPERFAHNELTLEGYMWAHSVLRSRSHRISIKDADGEWQKAMCLVPGADLFNTDVDSARLNVECQTDPNGIGIKAFFVCTARADVLEGEELISEYVSNAHLRTNSLLLMDYGFVPSDNPHNSVQVTLPPLTAAHKPFHKKLLEHLKLNRYASLPATLPTTEDKRLASLALVSYFRVHAIEEDEVDTKDRYLMVTAALHGGDAVNRVHEARAIGHLVRVLENMLEQFPTSLSDDSFLLRDMAQTDQQCAETSESARRKTDYSDDPRKKRMGDILRLRLSEKQLLTDLVHFYRTKLKHQQ